MNSLITCRAVLFAFMSLCFVLYTIATFEEVASQGGGFACLSHSSFCSIEPLCEPEYLSALHAEMQEERYRRMEKVSVVVRTLFLIALDREFMCSLSSLLMLVLRSVVLTVCDDVVRCNLGKELSALRCASMLLQFFAVSGVGPLIATDSLQRLFESVAMLGSTPFGTWAFTLLTVLTSVVTTFIVDVNAASHMLCVTLVTVCCFRLCFEESDCADKRMLLRSLDVFASIVRGKVPIVLRFIEGRGFTCAPDAMNTILAFSLIMLMHSTSVCVTAVICNALLVFALLPWPTVLPYGDVTGTIDAVCLVSAVGLPKSAHLMRMRQLTPLTAKLLRFDKWKRKVYCAALAPVLATPGFIETLLADLRRGEKTKVPEAFDVHRNASTHLLQERVIRQVAKAPLPPYLCHAFPSHVAVAMLLHELQSHPFRRFTKPQHVAAASALLHSVVHSSDASVYTAAKVLCDEDFPKLVALCLAELDLVRRNTTTTTQKYTLDLGTNALLPAQLMHCHLETCAIILHIAHALLSNQCVSGDICDVKPLPFLCHSSVFPTVRALLEDALLLQDLVVWDEGSGESFALPPLKLHIENFTTVRIEGPEQSPLRSCWMRVRGAAAELLSTLLAVAPSLAKYDPELTLTLRIPSLSLSSSGGVAYASVQRTSPGATILNSCWCRTQFVRLAFVLQKRFFRGDVASTSLAQLVGLLCSLWRIVCDRAGDLQTDDFSTLTFHEYAEAVVVVGGGTTTLPAMDESLVPQVLRSCHGKPVLLYLSLIALQAVRDTEDKYLCYQLAHLMEMLSQSTFAPQLTVSPLGGSFTHTTALFLKSTLTALHATKQHLAVAFLSPLHGGNFAGNVYLIEPFFRDLYSSSILFARIIAKLTRVLWVLSQSAPGILLADAALLLDALPLTFDSLRSIVTFELGGGDLPVDFVENTATAAYRRSMLYAFHRREVRCWCDRLLQRWNQVRAFAAEALQTCTLSEEIRRNMVQCFKFPAGVVVLEVTSLPRCEGDEGSRACAICLEELREDSVTPTQTVDNMSGIAEVCECHHRFHAHCLFLWVAGAHLECPVCRGPMA